MLVSRQPHGTHSRCIVNQDELVRKCNATARRNIVFRCVLLPGGLDTRSKVHVLQSAQVMVTMCGGDTINALHMKKNALVVELVNQAFSDFGPQSWVWQHKRWVTQTKSLSDRSVSKSLQYRALTVPSNRTIPTPTSNICLNRLTQYQRQWECIWNNDMHIS